MGETKNTIDTEHPKDPTENMRNADEGRKDKSDNPEKFDETKGADYQVTIGNGETSRDAIKEDRG